MWFWKKENCSPVVSVLTFLKLLVTLYIDERLVLGRNDSCFLLATKIGVCRVLYLLLSPLPSRY